MYFLSIEHWAWGILIIPFYTKSLRCWKLGMAHSLLQDYPFLSLPPWRHALGLLSLNYNTGMGYVLLPSCACSYPNLKTQRLLDANFCYFQPSRVSRDSWQWYLFFQIFQMYILWQSNSWRDCRELGPSMLRAKGWGLGGIECWEAVCKEIQAVAYSDPWLFVEADECSNMCTMIIQLLNKFLQKYVPWAGVPTRCWGDTNRSSMWEDS